MLLYFDHICNIFHYTVLYCIILYSTIFFYTILLLCYIVSYYIILLYNVFCGILLCYTLMYILHYIIRMVYHGPPIKLHNIAYCSTLHNTAYYSIQNASRWECVVINCFLMVLKCWMQLFMVFEVFEVSGGLRFLGFLDV